MANRGLIVVALFGEDCSFKRRGHFEDTVSLALKQAALGKCIGGGSWVSDEPNYNIEFEVADDIQALALIRDTLRAASVGAATELLVGGSRYRVYDDSLQDLGPRAQEIRPSTSDKFGEMSSDEVLAYINKFRAELEKKYGGPKDPNRGA